MPSSIPKFQHPNTPLLKVCGMREPDNIKALLELGLDFMGFIFYEKSARNIDDIALDEIADVIDNQYDVNKVGVFVNSNLETILAKNSLLSLDYIQLHGQELPEFCQQVKAQGFKVIKAFSVGSTFDFSQLKAYEKVCDYFLFDTKGKLPGGNGFQFDWSILAEYSGELPFFLSGGIDANSVAKIQGFWHPKLFAIDVNSGFELAPALKDVKKIENFKYQYSNTKTI